MNKKLLISLTVPLIAGLLAVCFIQYEHAGTSFEVNITGSIIKFTRSKEMILVAKGRNSHVDMFKALGWSHAHDRYVQLCLFRLAARGELTKHLPFAESARKQDIKSNQMNLRESSKKSLPHMESRHVNQMQAYVDGINEYLRTHIRPLEFMLINFNPEPFDVLDVLTIYKYISYAGLNDICLIIEKLIIEVTQETDQINLLKDTFYPHLEIVDDELIEIYKSIKDIRTIADQETAHVSKLTNSNNWVVSGDRSESGKPIMGSDPHMDISKTPNIFYENHYVGDDGHTFFGISAPGFSGYLMGRSHHIAMSFTYGMLDMSDYFIENVNSHKEYERDGKFFAFKERMVIIAGKTYYFYDTLEGHTLERSLAASEQPISAGKYLATKFSLTIQADTYIPNLFNIPLEAKTVYDVQDSLKLNSLGTNLLASDSLGNIAYQQGGMVAIRGKANGLAPLPAWKSENLWQGYLQAEDYHSVVNPPEGFLATANNHIQNPEKPIVGTFSALDNRVSRIRQLLKTKDKFSTEDFKLFQSDTHSLLAAKVIPIIVPYLGGSEIEKALSSWDYKSRIDSKPAALFKIIMSNLSRNMLRQFFTKDRVEKYLKYCSYPLLTVVNKLIDSKNPIAFNDKVFQDTVKQSLQEYQGQIYGDVNQITFRNILLGGRLPQWIGLDRNDQQTSHCEECIKVGTNRTSPLGEHIYMSQAWRMVTDMGSNIIETVLPGGPSGNFLSNFYLREIELFLSDGYKKIEL